MEKDFEKDLLSSLATKDKVNLDDFAEYFDNTLDVNKHAGLLVQVQAPKEIMKVFLGIEPILLIPTEFIQGRLNSESGVLAKWAENFNKPFIREDTAFNTGLTNNSRTHAYMAMVLSEIFNTGFVKRMSDMMKKDFIKEGMSEGETRMLLLSAKMGLTTSLCKACNAVNIKIQDNDSMRFLFEFNTETFNSENDITQFISSQEVIPFQFTICGYITKEQQKAIEIIPNNKLGKFEDGFDESDCDCPTCRIMKELGIKPSEDED